MTDAPFVETRETLRAPVTGALRNADWPYCLIDRFRVFSTLATLDTKRPE
jgi:hypothetical protein